MHMPQVADQKLSISGRSGAFGQFNHRVPAVQREYGRRGFAGLRFGGVFMFAGGKAEYQGEGKQGFHGGSGVHFAVTIGNGAGKVNLRRLLVAPELCRYTALPCFGVKIIEI